MGGRPQGRLRRVNRTRWRTGHGPEHRREVHRVPEHDGEHGEHDHRARPAQRRRARSASRSRRRRDLWAFLPPAARCPRGCAFSPPSPPPPPGGKFFFLEKKKKKKKKKS